MKTKTRKIFITRLVKELDENGKEKLVSKKFPCSVNASFYNHKMLS